MKVCNFIKKRLQHSCFTVNVAKFLRTHILKNSCEQQLLYGGTLRIGYSFPSADDQFDTLNKVILECIERHAPLKSTKFTRPPALWMKGLDTVALQNQRNK